MTSPHGNVLLARRDSSREPCSAQSTAPLFFRPVAVRGQVLARDIIDSAGRLTAECVGHNPSQQGKLRGWHLFIRQAKPRRPVPQVRGKVIGDCSHALATPLLIIREASIDDFVVPTLEERCCAAGHDCGIDTHAGCVARKFRVALRLLGEPVKGVDPLAAAGSAIAMAAGVTSCRSPQPYRDLSHAHGSGLISLCPWPHPKTGRVQSIGR